MDAQQVSAALSQGLMCYRQGVFSEAASVFQSVLAVDPNHPRALHLLALTMAALGHSAQAKALLSRTIQVDPTDISAVSNLAKLQLADGELGAAIHTARCGMSTRPNFAPLHCTEGSAYLGLGQAVDALCAFERARMVDPSSSDADVGVRSAMSRLGLTWTDAASSSGVKLLLDRGFYLSEGEQLYDAGVYHAALRCLRRSHHSQPENVAARSLYVLSLMHACEWGELEQVIGGNLRSGGVNSIPLPPFSLLALVDDPVSHLKQAHQFFSPNPLAKVSRSALTKNRKPSLAGSRPKVAYLSADFHDHATSRLMVEMLEAHDRQLWDVIGVSFGPEEDTPLRRRMKAAFEHFLDVRHMTDDAVARELERMGVDIVVDVKGLTEGCREGIFLQRPAPVVVSFLAYPGSMGTKAYDYIIGDAVVTPAEHAAVYDECIVQLPGTYQCNGRNRPMPREGVSKEQHGLPPNGFVFAAFNNTYKIQAGVFDIWMQILAQVGGSVLWLTCDDPSTQSHLRQQAASRGVIASRLIFAPKMPWADHLQRMQCADLFLDTWPYNAHTTASDALWMGLPVVTRKGQSFASRVAASLLCAMGLPELVTETNEAYRELAVSLASRADDLAQVRQRVISLRDSSPLFDAGRFAANLEQAFALMLSRAQSRQPPQAFAIRDVHDGGGCRVFGDSAFVPVPNPFRASAK